MQVCDWQKVEIKRLLSSWRQLQLLRAILEEISVVRLSRNQLAEVESARYIAIGRRCWLGHSISINVEVLIVLIFPRLGMRWI
jgi:hypothetical protein